MNERCEEYVSINPKEWADALSDYNDGVRVDPDIRRRQKLKQFLHDSRETPLSIKTSSIRAALTEFKKPYRLDSDGICPAILRIYVHVHGTSAILPLITLTLSDCGTMGTLHQPSYCKAKQR